MLLLLLLLLILLLLFRDRASLCSLDCPRICSVDQAGLELRNLPASVSRVHVTGGCELAEMDVGNGISRLRKSSTLQPQETIISCSCGFSALVCWYSEVYWLFYKCHFLLVTISPGCVAFLLIYIVWFGVLVKVLWDFLKIFLLKLGEENWMIDHFYQGSHWGLGCSLGSFLLNLVSNSYRADWILAP